MPRPQRALTAEQQTRLDIMLEILRRPSPVRMVDILFNTDAATKLVMTGEIVGFSPGEEEPTPPPRKSAGGTSYR